MIESIGFTIPALIFTVIITVCFYMKKQYFNIETYIYKFLLILTNILLVLEIICVYTMSIRDTIIVLNEILCRIYVAGAITWDAALVTYVISLNSDETDRKKFFNSFFVRIVWLSIFIMFVISCFLPLTYTSGSKDQFYVIAGPSTVVLSIPFILGGIYLLYILLRRKNKSAWFKRLPVLISVILYFLVAIYQVIFTSLNIFTFMLSICVTIMYFTLENQDYKLSEELEIAKKEEENADREKTLFLSRMSHEIRTPMNTIMGFSESLMNDKSLTKEKINEDIKSIYVAGNSLLEIINNILDISRIESGKETIEKNEYKLKDIVYELNSFIVSKINRNKVSFIVEINEKLPSNYYGDKIKIYKILSNILSNSAKFTETGEIRLKINGSIENNIAHLVFEISDTGCGIKEDDFVRLFEKFSKLDQNQEKDISGTGLGLAIIKQYVDLIGGEVTLNSEYGIGTTFYIKLNEEISDYSHIGSINVNEIVSDKKEFFFDCYNKRILIVDDNEMNLNVMKRLLEPYKAKISTAKTGNQCVEIVKSNEHLDLILLDHLMPEMDGIETVNILRKLNKKLPPIIAMTANVVTESKEKYIQNGFDDYISKPVDYKMLNKLLLKYFK